MFIQLIQVIITPLKSTNITLEENELSVLYPRETHIQYFVEHRGDKFFIMTNADGAYNYKLVEVSVNDTSKSNWKEVIPHRPDVKLHRVQVFKDYLVIWELYNTLISIRYKNQLK